VKTYGSKMKLCDRCRDTSKKLAREHAEDKIDPWRSEKAAKWKPRGSHKESLILT